jgi:prevent-host-death family protein
MVYNIVMITVNVYEAKAKLSELLDAAGSGQRVVICRHNQPVAELRPIEAISTTPRDLTPMYPGATFTPAAFFEPLADDEIAMWEGIGGDPPQVAEHRPTYPSRSTRRRTSKTRR